MIGTLFELAASAVQTFLLSWFITNFFGLKYNKFISLIGFITVWIPLFLEISFINRIVVYDSFLSGLIVVTLVIYCRLCLTGKIYTHAFASLFSIAIIFTIGSITIFSVSYVSGVEPALLMSEFSIWRVIVVIISKILEFLAFKSIIRIKEEYTLTVREWILFISVTFMTWAVITFMTKAALAAPIIVPYAFYSSLIMGVVSVLIYYFLLRLNRDTKTKLELEMLKMQDENMKKTETNMKALYDNTYAVKHDLEKHFLAIQAMAEGGNNQNISEYVASVIKNNVNFVQKIVFTSSEVFNAIINTRLEICKQKNIYASVKILDDPVDYIKSEDMTVLFGNIFDNAIEAAEKTDKKIIIFTLQRQGDYISVYMENSFDKRYSDVNLVSTKNKSEGHGFGIKSVKRIVSQYEGMIKFFENDAGMFCCDILLNISK